jgi:hypothetical protein
MARFVTGGAGAGATLGMFLADDPVRLLPINENLPIDLLSMSTPEQVLMFMAAGMVLGAADGWLSCPLQAKSVAPVPFSKAALPVFTAVGAVAATSGWLLSSHWNLQVVVAPLSSGIALHIADNVLWRLQHPKTK